jgi:hypothetical protein
VIIVGKFKINKRSLKYGSNSIILIAIVVAIAVVVNLIVGFSNLKLDLTADKLYSLSDESKTIIKGLKPEIKKDVTIYGLFDDGKIPSGNAYSDLLNLLNDYKQLGIKITYIDPDKDPGTIASLDKDKTKNLQKYDFVVKYGNKIKKLSINDLYGDNSQYGTIYKAEPLITGAIKFVTAKETPIAYFVEGHNEYSLTKDLTQIKAELETNNFEVKPLSLITSDKIPSDCKMLVFASPKSDLSEAEKLKVNAYMKSNGRAVFLFDALESKDKFANFEDILAGYNIGLNYDKVKEKDESRHIRGDEYSFVATLETNDINAPFNSMGQYPMFLPDSRSLTVLKNAKEWLKTTSLIKTSDKAESDSIINQGTTEKGPFSLAIASEITGSSKVLAFGNAVFMTDNALSSQYSTNFSYDKVYFMNTVANWIQDKSDETTISPKLISQKTISTTESQTKLISILLIGVLPILIMICGLIVWVRRRHL